MFGAALRCATTTYLLGDGHVEAVSEILRDLPGAQLDTGTADNPTWRVNGKVIVRRNPLLDRPAVEEVIAVRTSLDERGALLDEDPSTFFVTDPARSRDTPQYLSD